MPRAAPSGLENTTIGMLTVVRYIGRGLWECRCGCGNIRNICTSNIVNRRRFSCGCKRGLFISKSKTQHGHGYSKNTTGEYRAWCEMKGRCFCFSNPAYASYGGRGITVHADWLGRSGFPTFLLDMGYKPSKEYTLERIDNNGNYEPGNVRWATRADQNRNKRNSVRITYNGTTRVLAEWARVTGIDHRILSSMIKMGVPLDIVFNLPCSKIRTK